MKFLFLLAIIFYLNFVAIAKTFLTCELARALAKEGVPRVLISNCEKISSGFGIQKQRIEICPDVCLAEAVSGSNTSKITKVSPSRIDYGIFQINTKEYCGSNGKPGGKCNMTCESEKLSHFTSSRLKFEF